MRSFTWFILVCIAAFAWESRALIKFHWMGLTAQQKTWWGVGLSVFFGLIFAHLLKPVFWYFLS
jgi:hypothetical protein